MGVDVDVCVLVAVGGFGVGLEVNVDFGSVKRVVLSVDVIVMAIVEIYVEVDVELSAVESFESPQALIMIASTNAGKITLLSLSIAVLSRKDTSQFEENSCLRIVTLCTSNA